MMNQPSLFLSSEEKHVISPSEVYRGHAVFTLKNEKTQNRFTYKIVRPRWNKKENFKPIYHVSVFVGPDNESPTSYKYIGTIREGGFQYNTRSEITSSAKSVQVFIWFEKVLRENKLPNFIKIYHEGFCLRCGRTLTVPESILSGIGPECQRKISL